LHEMIFAEMRATIKNDDDADIVCDVCKSVVATLHARSRWRPARDQGQEDPMAMFEGPDRNRKILIAVIVVVGILAIIYIYLNGRLPGI
jgi:hypothetical protein